VSRSRGTPARRAGGCASLLCALALGGCLTRPPSAPPSAAPGASPAQLLAAIQADAARSDAAAVSERESLAADAERHAEACLAQAPQTAVCQYGEAVALGLGARAHPTRAGAMLGQMLAALGRAEALDPTLDQAGPARVRALVLARAPGWPLGPGDADAAVNAAREAVALRPDYPPNQLALAEALSKSGDTAAARERYQAAAEAARSAPPGAERDGWLRDAERGLAHP